MNFNFLEHFLEHSFLEHLESRIVKFLVSFEIRRVELSNSHYYGPCSRPCRTGHKKVLFLLFQYEGKAIIKQAFFSI